MSSITRTNWIDCCGYFFPVNDAGRVFANLSIQLGKLRQHPSMLVESCRDKTQETTENKGSAFLNLVLHRSEIDINFLI